MPDRRLRLLWMRLIRIYRRLARSSGTAHEIALGVAAGVFVAMTPTVGIQMVLAVILATLLRANRLASLPPVWITNPLTVPIIYPFNYWLGLKIVGGPDLKAFGAFLKSLLTSLDEDGVVAALRLMLGTSGRLMLPLWMGCCLAGLVLALPAYLLARRSVNLFRHRLHRKRASRAARILRWQSAPLPSPPADAGYEILEEPEVDGVDPRR